jgi:MFS family permease
VGRLQTLFGADADVVHDDAFRVLLVGSLVSPLGAAVVSPLLDTLTGTFATTEATVGLLMAVFTAPAVVLVPVAGMLSDRLGRKPVLVAGLLCFGVGGTAVSLTTDIRVALALRFLQGVGYCGIAPVLIASVGDLYAGDREATAQGLRFTTVGVSMTAFPLLAGVLVALSWRYPFYLFALAFPAAVAVVLVFEEPTDADHGDTGGGAADLLGVLRTGSVLATVVGRTVPSFVWFAFLTYNSIVVVRLLDGSPGIAGALVALASLTASLGATQVGRLTAAFETRTAPLAGAGVVSGLGLAGLAVAPDLGPSLAVAAASVLVLGSGFGVAITLYRSELSRLGPEATRGGLVSVGESVGRLGSTVAPVAVGAGVAALRPAVGFGGAVRTALLGVVVCGVVVAVACAVLALRLPTPPGGRVAASADD